MWWIPAQILASRFECTSRWSTPWFSHLLAKLRLPWNAYSTLVPIVFDKQPIWSDAGSFEVRHSRPSPPYFTWKTIRASISPCAPHAYAIAPIIGLDIIKFRRRPCSVHTTPVILCVLIIPCIPVFPIVWRAECFRPAGRGNLVLFPFSVLFLSLLLPLKIKENEASSVWKEIRIFNRREK